MKNFFKSIACFVFPLYGIYRIGKYVGKRDGKKGGKPGFSGLDVLKAVILPPYLFYKWGKNNGIKEATGCSHDHHHHGHDHHHSHKKSAVSQINQKPITSQNANQLQTPSEHAKQEKQKQEQRVAGIKQGVLT